jgi:D-galactose 1-dehydrogenase
VTVTDVAIVGVGKIARDEHVPAISANASFRLAATASRSGGLDGVENHGTLDALLEARPDIPAVALCMPPQVRYEAAEMALLAKRHVLLEKPPGATVAEVYALERLAEEAGTTLYATWHSRHAAAVPAAKKWLSDKAVRRATITWREDVRHWHPGQDWIWRAGAMGVFDPGINALSILTEILPVPVHVKSAELDFPANRETPIAARLEFGGRGKTEVSADFDWQITLQTDEATVLLSAGGAELSIDGAAVEVRQHGEYPAIYRHFADLISRGASDVDVAPLVHVADAFMLGRRLTVDPFHD